MWLQGLVNLNTRRTELEPLLQAQMTRPFQPLAFRASSQAHTLVARYTQALIAEPAP